MPNVDISWHKKKNENQCIYIKNSNNTDCIWAWARLHGLHPPLAHRAILNEVPYLATDSTAAVVRSQLPFGEHFGVEEVLLEPMQSNTTRSWLEVSTCRVTVSVVNVALLQRHYPFFCCCAVLELRVVPTVTLYSSRRASTDWVMSWCSLRCLCSTAQVWFVNAVQWRPGVWST